MQLKSLLYLATFMAAMTLQAGELTPEFDAGGTLRNYEKLAFIYDVRLKNAWQAVTDLNLIGTTKAKNYPNAIQFYNHKTERGNMQLISSKLPVVDGKHYQLNFKAENQSKDTAWLYADLYFYNKDGNQVWRYFKEFESFAMCKNQWLEYQIDFEVPRTGATYVQIKFNVGGDSFNAFLSDIDFKQIPPEKILNRHAGTALLNAGADLTVWSDIVQVQTPYTGIPANLKKTPLRLAAAGNETESIQVILSPKKTMNRLKLEFSTLKDSAGNIIDASNWSFRRIGFLDIPESIGNNKSGKRPDVLFEETNFTAPANVNTPLLVEVKVPANTPKGIYQGSFKVVSGNSIITEFPVNLRVFGFNLPDSAHLKTLFYARHNEFNAFDNRQPSQVADDIFTLLKEHRINGNQGENVPMPQWAIENNNLVIKSFTDFDAFVEKRVTKDNMRVLLVPYLYFFGDTGGFYKNPDRSIVFGEKYNSALGQQYLKQFAAAFDEHVKAKFPGVEFVAYLWDEPRLGNIEELQTIIKAVKAGAPQLKLFLTAPFSLSKFFPEVEVWCEPHQPFVNPLDENKLQSTEFWLYNWSASLSEIEYFQARLFPYMVYLNNGSGALLWQIFDIPNRINPLNNIDKTYDCGSATIVYPDPARPNHFLSSQRFIQMREGIDDFDYMKILENRAEKQKSGSGKNTVKKILMQIIKGPGLNYNNNPAMLEKIRTDLAEAIEKSTE